MTKDAELAVVVVAYNSADTIEQTVQSAFALASCSTVVVVDNGVDGSGDIAERAGAVVLRRPDNPGFGTSHNMGVAATHEQFVLLLNSDAEIVPDGVKAGVDLLLREPDVAATQGIITSRRTGSAERSMGPELRWVHLIGRALGLRTLLGTKAGRRAARLAGVGDVVDRIPTSNADVETLAATAPLVRRLAFDEVNGFDEGFFLYGEDLDLCYRLRTHNWRLVGMPVGWATHDDGSTADSRLQRELNWWSGTLRHAALRWSTSTFTCALLASGCMTIRLGLGHPSKIWSVASHLLVRPLSFRRTAATTRRLGPDARV